MSALAFPHHPLSGTPFEGVAGFDLSTRKGLALLRRLDASLRHADATTRRAALMPFSWTLPLASRGQGLMVLPGGALILRQDATVLTCDPASAAVLGREALQAIAAFLPASACRSIGHEAAGLRLQPGLPAEALPQHATLVEPGALLAPWLPQAAGWQGPALLRWGRPAGLAWEMGPLGGRLALAASILGEILPDNSIVPSAWWNAPTGDERYQLLSTGLSAHLDELLSNEVGDALRFALIAHWTDGEASQASHLADGLGLLPACFAAPFDQPVGLRPLRSWPVASSLLAGASTPFALLGIAPDEAPAAWTPAARQAFLRGARQILPAGSLLLSEDCPALLPLAELGADRLARQTAAPLGILCPVADRAGPLDLLATAQNLAQGSDLPVTLAVPQWGLCQIWDAQGQGLTRGNAAWFGFAGGLAELSELF